MKKYIVLFIIVFSFFVAYAEAGETIDGLEIVNAESVVIADTLTVAGDTNLGGGDLFVDASTNNVGIGMTAPSSEIDIAGNIDFSIISAPTAPTIASVSAGGSVDDATNYYRITYVTAKGETEFGTVSAAAVTSGGNNTVNLSSIPISSSPTVTARKIYRGSENSPYYRYVATLSDNTTTVYTDTAANSSLEPLGKQKKDDTLIAQFTRNDTQIGKISISSTAFGYNALPSYSEGFDNVAFGADTLSSNLTGYNNVAIGNFAMNSNQYGDQNVAVGDHALQKGVSCVANTGIGNQALQDATTGSYNMAIGRSSLLACNANNNTAIGYYSATKLTSGTSNTAIGFGCMSAGIVTGSVNTAIGSNCMDNVSSGIANVAIGSNALSSNTTGGNNTAIGFYAGRYHANGSTALTDAENSIYIGYNVQGKDNSDSNSIVIGYEADGLGANTVVLGNNSIVTTALKGNVGIGETSPTAKLHVAGDMKISSDVTMTGLPSGSTQPAGVGTGQLWIDTDDQTLKVGT